MDEASVERLRSALGSGRVVGLCCDYQPTIIGNVFGEAEDDARELVTRTARVQEILRGAEIELGHVRVAFREGYGEVTERHKLFSGVKAAGKLLDGTEGAAFHPSLAPKGKEPEFVKRRVGAASSTDLATWLRARDATTILLMGLSTSGVILSTLCWACDHDFTVIVVKDCCGDKDPTVHSTLTEKVFLKQAFVVDAETLTTQASSLAGKGE